MKFSFSVLLLAAFAAETSFASPSVTAVAAHQRWPWSPVVDIDLICEGDGTGDLVLTATFDGADAPIDLTAGLVGDDTSLYATPGVRHFVWSPEAAGFGNQKLENFAVSATVVSSDSRKYLVVDLTDGSCQYYSDEPAGDGWHADAYMTRYMVFRRIPAGTYRIGYTDEQMAHLKDIGLPYQYNFSHYFGARTITITTDYYIGIYQVTMGQRAYFTGWADGRSYKTVDSNAKINTWRGYMTNAAAHVTWPIDGHKVAPDSHIGKFRATCQKLPKNMIVDLPTEAQWEIAARAGKADTYYGYADGGTTTSTWDDILATKEAAFVANATTAPGTKLGNLWGIFDTQGEVYEMVLNVCEATAGAVKDLLEVTPQCYVAGQMTDPVGMTVEPSDSLYALACNCGWGSHNKTYNATLPNRAAFRAANAPGEGSNVGARLCINLKPLVK